MSSNIPLQMDLTTHKYYQTSPRFPSNEEHALDANTSFYGRTTLNPFVETFSDPLCKLNLKETSEFAKSFPTGNNNTIPPEVGGRRRSDGANSVTTTQKRLETQTQTTTTITPCTPGRPIFGFSSGGGNFARRSFPSKWDDAEKWLISSSCISSPAHVVIKSPENQKVFKHFHSGFDSQIEVFAEKSRVTEEKVSNLATRFQGSLCFDHQNSAGTPGLVVRDKFTDDVGTVLPTFRCSEPSKEGFLFRNSASEPMKDASTEVVHNHHEVQHRDVGTEMTPLASSTNSRCHTPFMVSSPPRHNTPASRSGPLAFQCSHTNGSGNGNFIDIAQLQECHFAKLQLGTHYDSVTSNWSSREEEEEEVSKSLRHFDNTHGVVQKNCCESKTSAWEEEEKMKCCLRYQREEAKIQAWVNLQSAKAEAQSKKLEVKIQRMRSNLEEKLMRSMAMVQRKAEEWRVEARKQHTEQLKKTSEQANKMTKQFNTSYTTCGCFPCTNTFIN